jgi:hypothetical protein
MVVEGGFQAIKILLLRYFSTRRFAGHGTREKRKFVLENMNVYIPCLPKERPLVVELSDGFPF